MKEYRVLARKYRPQKFTDLIGQETLVKIVTNSIKNNRIAHAYILTGVRGVGKTTTARIIAMSLNCQNKSEGNYEPCGDCNSCNSIRSDQNLDVIELDAASKTGVDDIREIIDNVKYKPVDSLYKVFIIDEVHMLSKNAFNALLKTLEEPPEHVKFIFATTEVKKIPITVISRCQRFDLSRIENSVLSKHLLNISKLEKVNINNDALALIVRAADGSVRDGLSILDQAIANHKENINSKLIIDMLGLADRGKIFDLLDSIFKGNAVEAIKIYNDLYNSGADIIMIFDEMLNAVHFITQMKISQNLREDNFIPELERERGYEISSNLDMASLGIIWQVLFKGFNELQNTSHIFQHGEMIILRLIYLNDGPGPEEILNKYRNKKDNSKYNNDIINSSKNSSNSEIKNEVIKKEENINYVRISKDKINAKLNIKSYRMFVNQFYMMKEGILHTKLYNNVKLISFKEGEVVFNSSSIKDKHFNRTVAKLISKWTGRIWQVHSSNSNIGKSLSDEDVVNQQKEIEKIKNNSEIKKIFEKFPGIKIHSITDLTEAKDETLEKIKINKEKEG